MGSKDANEFRIMQPTSVQRNMVTIYNQDTFDIGKIRVNRVITVRQLLTKIASFLDLDNYREIQVRVGDLDQTFDASTSDLVLDKLIF